MAEVEYQAARESAALFDRSDAGKIAVAGADRLSYLHAMFTQDILALQPGTGGYSAYLTPQGRMISDMRVLELGDTVLLDLPASQVSAVVEKLDQFIFSEDVKLGDLTEAFGKVSVVGPLAADVVRSVLDGAEAGTRLALEAWPEFRNRRVEWEGDTVVLARTADLGLAGFDLYVERPRLEALAAALAGAGALPASRDVAEVLRVEAGLPAFGKDMDADTIPLEAGIDVRAISFTKGCYPGQEVIIRVVHRGHGRVARRLTGLLLDGRSVPAPGALLRGGERDAGRVTSAVFSPALDRPIAIAMVQRDFFEPGTQLTVLHGDQTLVATTTGLPFEAND